MLLYIFTGFFIFGCFLLLLYILQFIEPKEKTGLSELNDISIDKMAIDKIKRDIKAYSNNLTRIEQKYLVLGKNFNSSAFILQSLIYAFLTSVFSFYMFSKIEMVLLFFIFGLSIHWITIDTKYRKFQHIITKNMKNFIKVLDANAIGASNVVDIFIRSLKSLSSPYKEQIEEVLERSQNSSFEYELSKLAIRLDNDYLRMLSSNFSRAKISGSNIRNPLIALSNMIEKDEKDASDVRGKKKGQMWKFYIILIINFGVMFLIRVFAPDLFKEILMSDNGLSLGSCIAIALSISFVLLHLIGKE